VKRMRNGLQISRALRSFSVVKAPATLLPAVLRRVGLADHYWRLESPVGPVFVAHSKAGISMVTRAKSGAGSPSSPTKSRILPSRRARRRRASVSRSRK